MELEPYFYEEGIHNLVVRKNMCLNKFNSEVEKKRMYLESDNKFGLWKFLFSNMNYLEKPFAFII